MTVTRGSSGGSYSQKVRSALKEEGGEVTELRDISGYIRMNLFGAPEGI
jgi:hypothetical protein